MSAPDAVARRVAEEVDRGWEREVALLADLVRRPSVLGQEARAQARVAEELADLGLAVETWDVDAGAIAGRPGFGPVEWSFAGRPNVAARWPAAAPGGRSLVLNGHIDVVPATPEHHWRHDPWGAEVADGRMWGRGAADMKAGIAAMLAAVRAVRAAGVGLRGDVVLQSVVEEECTGNGTLSALARGLRADAALIPEPLGQRALAAQVGVLWARVTVRGAGAHAEQADQAVNAVVKAAGLLDAVRELEVEANAEPRPGPFAEHAHPLNYNVGQIHGGDWTSSVPERCVFEVRIGTLPGQGLEAVKERFATGLVAAATADPWLAEHPPEVSFHGFHAEGYVVPADTPELAALGRAHRAVTGQDLETAAFTGTTDARSFSLYHGVPATCYGPVGGALHAPDEWVDLDSVRATTQVLARTLLEWCGVA